MNDTVRMTIAMPREVYNRLAMDGRRYMRRPRDQAHWLLFQAVGYTPEERSNRAQDAKPSAVAE